MAYPRTSNSYTEYGNGEVDPRIPQFDPAAPKPAPYRRPTTISGQVREGLSNVVDAVKSAPKDIAGAARSFARNPIEEFGAATAPMAGTGHVVSAVPRAAAALRGAEASVQALGRDATLINAAARNALPSARQVVAGGASGAVGLAGAGVALGQVDRAQQDAQRNINVNMVDNGQHLPDSVLRNPRNARVRMVEDGEMLPDNVLQRPGATKAKDIDYGPGSVAAMEVPVGSMQRRGTQGAVIKNPHGMSMEDRLRGLLTSMKGSPSMRRAAAEAMLSERNNEFAAGQNALNRNADAESQTNELQARSREAFADRRMRADTFNLTLADKRRQDDASNELEAASIVSGASRRGAASSGAGAGAGAAAKDPEKTFISARYKELIDADMDPDQALQVASRMGTQAGIVEDDPITRYGQARDADRLGVGRQKYNDRWLSSSNPDFDPSTATPRERSFWDRVGSDIWLPGANSSDVEWVDANGNVDYTGRDALPEGETPTTYSQRLMREREIRAARAARENGGGR